MRLIIALSFTGLISCLAFSASAIESVVVKGLFKDMAIVTIDGKQRILKAGKASPEGAKLVTANSEQAIIEIQGHRETYKLGQHIANRFTAAPEKASIIIAPDRNGMFEVSGSINGFSIKFLVDTGATLIAMNEIQAKRLGLDYKLSGSEGLTRTASGTARSWYIKLKKVKVGALSLPDVDAAVIQGNYPAMVLLGNSFLNRFKMIRNGQLMELSTK